MTTTQEIKVEKANRKSAVERLEESKANYVKTERVLDCKQEFKHSSTLHVSTGPPIDVILRGHVKTIYNSQNVIQYVPGINQSENHNNEVFHKEISPRSCNIFDSKARTQGKKKDSQPVNKKVISRSSEFSDLGSTYEENSKTLPSSSKEGENASFTQPGRINIAVENDFTVTNIVEPSHHVWKKSEELIEGNYTFLEVEHLSNHEQSEGEVHSSDETKDSLSTEDITDLGEKYHGSRTSDYVSRSSSFKGSIPSDRVRNLVNRFESRFNQNDCLPSANVSTSVNGKEKKKSVSRSKSDVSHRFSKGVCLASEKRDGSDAELERFFSTMGLDTTVWHHLTAPPRSPARFFDSISSLNSEDHHSSVCSEDSVGETHKEGLTNRDLQKHAPTETSIVEKNARVVKWLYNCHNANREHTS